MKRNVDNRAEVAHNRAYVTICDTPALHKETTVKQTFEDMCKLVQSAARDSARDLMSQGYTEAEIALANKMCNQMVKLNREGASPERVLDLMTPVVILACFLNNVDKNRVAYCMKTLSASFNYAFQLVLNQDNVVH